jgi:hypothetical protein
VLAAFQATSTTTTTTKSRSKITNFATSTGLEEGAESTETSFSSQNENGSDGKNRGLGAGAKAGIGVGAGVGALALLGSGFFFAKVRQWKKASDAAKQNEGPNMNNSNQVYAPAPAWKEHSPIQNPAGSTIHEHEIGGTGLNEVPNLECLKQRNELP